MNYKFADKIHGMADDHSGFSPLFFQGNTNECAIFAQWNILRDYGIDIDEKTLVEQAKMNGWFTDEGGTPLEHVGKLLELNGVDCDMIIDGNRYNLMNELAQGKRVIVTVDSGELWRDNTVLSKLWEDVKDVFGSGEDHALVVSGIDTTDPDNIQVILTDSGTGHHTISYPLDQFENAWADGGCKMIVTHEPPPQSLQLPSMANFDYDLGHVREIGDIAFDEWQAEHSEEIESSSIFSDLDSPLADSQSAASGSFCGGNLEGTDCCEPDPMTAMIVDVEDIDGENVIDRLFVDLDGDNTPDIVINTNDGSILDISEADGCMCNDIV